MLHTLVLFLFLPLPTLVITTPSRTECGGVLTAEHGIIATPNFPNLFPTPIHCKWYIDAQYLRSSREPQPGEEYSIKIYMTQVYVQEGLTMDEYESEAAIAYPASGHRVFNLTDDAVTSNMTFIFIRKEFVVIEFRLDHAESTHLRVLDGLLNVFGFNITYEISTRPARENRCSMKLCGFTGFCHDDFEHFTCACFPGFYGRRCTEGPRSRCFVKGQPECKNGATCLHSGHMAIVCDCKPGWRGSFCEERDVAPSQGCGGDVSCLISCKFNGTMEDVCKCGGPKLGNNLRAINDSIGYSSRIFVQSKLDQVHLHAMLKRNMLDMLQVNISNIDDVNILSSMTANNESDITLRFYASKYQDELVRSTIRKWGRTQYARHDKKDYILTEKDILVKTEPYLYLENIAISKSGVISEGEEFFLSCTARGSRFMIFRWFKDGNLVNLTRANNNKWIKLFPKGHNITDHYTVSLVIQKASGYDRGEFTCHVEDYGIQQCRSLMVAINEQPSIKLEPASLTVEKGQKFQIKCMSLAVYGEKYKFSWTKDEHLLPIKTDTELYEILYPDGSILHVAGLNKSTAYSCLAHLDKLSTESHIFVHVVDKQYAHTCPAQHFDAISWPETATGTDCRQECPEGYYGEAIRTCNVQENGASRWLPPDYSNCTRLNELMQHLADFRNLEEGYAKTTPLQTLVNVRRYVSRKKLLRGEGRVILKIVERVVRFNNASRGYSDHGATTDVVLEVVDAILGQNESLNKEQQVITLQQIVRHQLMILAPHIITSYQKVLHNLQATIEIENYVNPIRTIRVNYRNLYEFLTKKSIIRLNYSDDREMNYELFAGVTSMWRLSNLPQNMQYPSTISSVFYHQSTQLYDNSVDALTLSLSESSTKSTQNTDSQSIRSGVVKCVLADYAASDYVWNAYKCHIINKNASSVQCECSEEGTMTILLVDDVLLDQPQMHLTHCDDIVHVGCAVCCLLCTISGALLVLSWLRHRSTMTFLKAQCSLSLAACMVCFIVGFSNSVSKQFYLNLLSLLMSFYLVALASQLSTLLIIYTDLIEMQRINSIKPTVVGVITGAPIISVFANHMTHNIKDITLGHWWIEQDTLSFYMFIVCIAIIFILYVILCCLVSKLIKTDKTKSDKILSNRSIMLTKSTLIFAVITISAGSSIGCVNNPKEIIWQYSFASTSIVMGVLIMMCLVFKIKAMGRKYIYEKILRRHGTDHPKEKTISTKSCKDGRSHHITHNKCDTTSNIESREQSPQIEEYSSSPTQYNTTGSPSFGVIKSKSLNSPDILGSKVFAELDLVASSLHTATVENTPPHHVSLKSINNSIEQIDENIDKLGDKPIQTKLSMGDICSYSADASASPSKRDKCVKFCDTIEYDSAHRDCEVEQLNECDANSAAAISKPLDEVMDGISNDLKYLLNDHQFTDSLNSISC